MTVEFPELEWSRVLSQPEWVTILIGNQIWNIVYSFFSLYFSIINQMMRRDGNTGYFSLWQFAPAVILDLEYLRSANQGRDLEFAGWRTLRFHVLEFHNLTPLTALTPLARMLTLVKFPDLVWTSELRRLHHQLQHVVAGPGGALLNILKYFLQEW